MVTDAALYHVRVAAVRHGGGAVTLSREGEHLISSKIRVLVVEDHVLMVDALTRRIENAGMEVVGECSSAGECMALYAEHDPDVVLCDVGLGDEGTGIELTEKLLANFPDAKVIMYSGYTEDDLIQEALDIGARGYIRKTSSVPDLIDCLGAAAAGERQIFDRVTSREMIKTLQRQAAKPVRDPRRLTPREQEILDLLVVGGQTTNKDLARTLTLSPQTVKSHLENIMGKLGVSNRVELANKAREEQLVTVPAARAKLPRRP